MLFEQRPKANFILCGYLGKGVSGSRNKKNLNSIFHKKQGELECKDPTEESRRQSGGTEREWGHITESMVGHLRNLISFCD